MRLLADAAEVDWAAATDGDWARAFLAPMLRDGVDAHLANVHTTLRIIQVDGQILPVTINESPKPSAWVVSPRNAYVDYAGDELREIDGAALRTGLHGALAGLGAILDAGQIDRLICVDNWCVSTNLHPEIASERLAEITHALVAAYPTHAIAWRSVHDWGGEALPAQLKALNYRPVPARSCWVWNPHNPEHLGARDLKHDARILRNSGYEVLGPDQLGADDTPRLRALYDALYLDKYSKHNPQMTDRFIAAAVAGGLHVRALKKDGRIDGVLGFFVRNGFMTTPLFGYDTSLPQKTGLYRMLSRVLVNEAIARSVVLHQSAGAASFKRNRHAESVFENTWVYTAHLGTRQKLAWTVLAQAMQKIAVPMVAARGL